MVEPQSPSTEPRRPAALAFLAETLASALSSALLVVAVCLPWQAVLVFDPFTRLAPSDALPMPAALCLAAALVLPVAAVLLGAIRRLGRHPAWAGPSLGASAVSSALAAVLTLAVGLGFLAAAGDVPGRKEMPWFLLATLATWVLLVAGGAVRRVLGTRGHGLPALLAGLACLGLGWAGFRLAADAWGTHRTARLRAEIAPEVAAERARVAALRMPVLRGEPIDGNAAPVYRKLLADVSAWPERRDPDKTPLSHFELSSKRVLDPLPEPVLKALEAHRGDVAALAEAVRHTRVDWGLDYSRDLYLQGPPLGATQWLAGLVIAEARERARAGDLRGASERLLDLARFGADKGAATFPDDWNALTVLGRLAVSDAGDEIPVADVLRELDLLEATVPDTATRLGWMRIQLAAYDVTQETSGNESVCGIPLGLPLGPFLPVRAIAASATVGALGLVGELQAAPPGSLAEARRARDRVDEALERSPNGLFHCLRVYGWEIIAADWDHAEYRLVKAALLARQARAADGLFPKDAAALDLPVDPFAAPARIRYEATGGGTGFRVWSVGDDLDDDGGHPDKDLVLERKAPAQEAAPVPGP